MTKNVLLIDDEEYITNALTFILKKKGLNCFSAGNGKKAMEVLDKNKIDLILTDLNMPVMDGFETTSLIREKTAYKNTPIIAYTGFVDKKHTSKARQAGVDEILTKPLTPDKIYTIISKYL